MSKSEKKMIGFFAKELDTINKDAMIIQIGLENYASATEADPSVIVHAIEMVLREYELLHDEMEKEAGKAEEE